MEEERLIGAAQAGDLKAFNQLVLSYQGLAYNVAYRLLNDADNAADATQDSFLKAYRALPGFRGGSFKSWLLRIVTNTCYDYLRSRRRRADTSLESLTEEHHQSHWLEYPGESPEQTTLRHERHAAIQAGIQRLQNEQRLTLVLADIEGFSYQEIAEITGVGMGTVKSRLSRARSHLRDILLRRPEFRIEKETAGLVA